MQFPSLIVAVLLCLFTLILDNCNKRDKDIQNEHLNKTLKCYLNIISQYHLKSYSDD
jgi:hypothetical protein